MTRPVDLLFPEQAEARKSASRCAFDYLDVDHSFVFREEIDHREFRISGMCQTCQDNFFGGEE